MRDNWQVILNLHEYLEAARLPANREAAVMFRFHCQARTGAIVSAIKHHLIMRSNERIASGNTIEGDRPRSPLGYLSGIQASGRAIEQERLAILFMVQNELTEPDPDTGERLIILSE